MLARGLVILLIFLSLGVAVVHVRTEQARAERNVQRLRAERAEHRRESWELQAQLSRLRAPRQIRDRVADWSINVRATWPEPGQTAPTAYASR